ncbi:MAG: hypothetical protein J7K84_05900, partial [Deltaproteobacteria bacterium]|nr:hypothetical protein [Deltaproteobacteria bacterium]
MSKDNEISSTEKLLALIRDDHPGESEPGNKVAPLIASKKTKSFSSKPVSSKQNITIGIYIGDNSLKLVRVDHSSEDNPELIDYAEVPLEPGIVKDKGRFSAFLKSLLTNYCGPSKLVNIWAVVASGVVEIRRLLIPGVSKKQIANAAYWSYKKNVSSMNRDDIFDFEVLGNVIEDSIQKIEITAYSVPKKVVDELQPLFSEAGYPLTGISSFPFALQNMVRTGWLGTDEDSSVCIIYINLERSHINIYSNGNLILSRVIKAGIHTMVDAIRKNLESILDNNPLLSLNKGGVSGSHTQTGNDLADEIFYNFIQETSSQENSVNKGDIFRALLPALERLVKQIERTLKHYYLNFGNKEINKAFISGLINNNSRIVEYIGSQLDINMEILNPFPKKIIASGAVTTSVPALNSGTMVPAAGIALSDNKITPNFIFTYKDREKVALVKHVNFSLFAFMLFLMAICVGVYFNQGRVLSHKEQVLSNLKRQIESYSPNADQDLLLKMALKIKKARLKLDNISNRHLGLAVISAISEITPENIRLLKINARLDGSNTSKNRYKKNKSSKKS